MTELKDKVKLALDEARLLVLGAQILLGFGFQSVFQPRFDRLPHASQRLKVLELMMMFATTLLLMWPASFQQISEAGEVTPRLYRFVTRMMCWALSPLSFAIAMQSYAVTEPLFGTGGAVALAIAVSGMALFFWYGLGSIAVTLGYGKEGRTMTKSQYAKPVQPTELFDKVDHVLTECRVVIPGAQALLGFQFIAILTDKFEKLPLSSKYVHLAALMLIALSAIVLMTPAAYHRIVEAGESTEAFWRHARRMLLSGMALLALGLATEFYVIANIVLNSKSTAIAMSFAALLMFYGLWFAYPVLRRRMKHEIAGSSGLSPSAVIS